MENLKTPTKTHFREVIENWGAQRKRGQEKENRFFYFDGITEGALEATEATELDEIPF